MSEEATYEVVVTAVADEEHAELLRKRLVDNGTFHDHAVEVREVSEDACRAVERRQKPLLQDHGISGVRLRRVQQRHPSRDRGNGPPDYRRGRRGRRRADDDGCEGQRAGLEGGSER